MARFTIKKTPAKVLRRLDRTTRGRIIGALDQLADDPDGSDLDIEPYEKQGAWRLRVGKWRIIFDRVERDDDELEIVVRVIRSRGDVYKR